MSKSNPWHFSRTGEANAAFAILKSGLVQSVTLFSPRRMGKSEFLREDLRPIAEAAGWQVLLYDFMDSAGAGEAPLTVMRFARALTRFALSLSISKQGQSVLERLRKFKVWAFEVELEKPADIDTRDAVRDAIAVMNDSKSPCLLLLDEVQELAKDSRNGPFIAALRMALDSAKGNVSVVFTGSSLSGLSLTFSNAKAPFFHFAKPLDFKPMGRDFSDFMVDVFNKTLGTPTKRNRLNNEAVWAAFNAELGRVPQALREVLAEIVNEPTMPFEVAVKQVRERMGLGHAYPHAWENLSVAERAILQKVAHGGRAAPYSRKTRGNAKSGLASAAAVKRLLRRGLLAHGGGYGAYVFEDNSFQEWVLRKTTGA
jgi:hypothetical protein